MGRQGEIMQRYGKPRLLLRSTRHYRNLKQDTIAQALGVSQPFYSRIESGQVDPRPELACEIARILSVDKRLLSPGVL